MPTFLRYNSSKLQMRKPILIAGVLFSSCAAFGQSSNGQSTNTLTFEVATVKKAEPPQPNGRGMVVAFGKRGGPGTSDPGQITWSNATAKSILTTAWGVKPYQVTGPDWLDSERFDIVAKVPPGTTKEQVNVMWQNLLAERFGLVLHHSSKVFQVEEMVVAKGGLKMKETVLDPNNPPEPEPAGPPFGAAISGGKMPAPGAPPPGMPQLDKNGVPQLNRPGLVMMMTMGPNGPNARMVGKAQSIADLATMVGNQLNHPVVDKTGLTGKYDFVLEFAPDPNNSPLKGGPLPPGPGPGPGPGDAGGVANASEPGGLNLVGALQQQLGLRLVSNKEPLDVLVIDQINRTPTDN
jgi:uncharacterized protein (TIGR03435 family)